MVGADKIRIPEGGWEALSPVCLAWVSDAQRVFFHKFPDFWETIIAYLKSHPSRFKLSSEKFPLVELFLHGVLAGSPDQLNAIALHPLFDDEFVSQIVKFLQQFSLQKFILELTAHLDKNHPVRLALNLAETSHLTFEMRSNEIDLLNLPHADEESRTAHKIALVSAHNSQTEIYTQVSATLKNFWNNYKMDTKRAQSAFSIIKKSGLSQALNLNENQVYHQLKSGDEQFMLEHCPILVRFCTQNKLKFEDLQKFITPESIKYIYALDHTDWAEGAKHLDKNKIVLAGLNKVRNSRDLILQTSEVPIPDVIRGLRRIVNYRGDICDMSFILSYELYKSGVIHSLPLILSTEELTERLEAFTQDRIEISQYLINELDLYGYKQKREEAYPIPQTNTVRSELFVSLLDGSSPKVNSANWIASVNGEILKSVSAVMGLSDRTTDNSTILSIFSSRSNPLPLMNYFQARFTYTETKNWGVLGSVFELHARLLLANTLLSNLTDDLSYVHDGNSLVITCRSNGKSFAVNLIPGSDIKGAIIFGSNSESFRGWWDELPLSTRASAAQTLREKQLSSLILVINGYVGNPFGIWERNLAVACLAKHMTTTQSKMEVTERSITVPLDQLVEPLPSLTGKQKTSTDSGALHARPSDATLATDVLIDQKGSLHNSWEILVQELKQRKVLELPRFTLRFESQYPLVITATYRENQLTFQLSPYLSEPLLEDWRDWVHKELQLKVLFSQREQPRLPKEHMNIFGGGQHMCPGRGSPTTSLQTAFSHSLLVKSPDLDFLINEGVSMEFELNDEMRALAEEVANNLRTTEV